MGLRVSDMHESAYLGKKELANPIRATIETVYMDEMNDGKTEPVMSFTDRGIKPMVLNVTNRCALRDAYGDECDGWRGKSVEIYHDPSVMHKGQRVGGSRVRIPSGPAPAQPAPSPAAPGAWTFAQAVDAVVLAGGTADMLKSQLKGVGMTTWNDNPALREKTTRVLISSLTAGVGEADDDSIPF